MRREWRSWNGARDWAPTCGRRSDCVSRLIRSDWHVHTNLSDCGHVDAAPMAMVRAAQEAGLEAIGITDHVIFEKDKLRPGEARRSLPRELDGLRVYVGCEADMQSPTRSSIDAEFAAGLDYVVMSASHLFEPGVEKCEDTSPTGMVDYIFCLMEGAINCGFADIIPHPFGVPVNPHSWEEMIAEVDGDRWYRLAEMAASAGVAIEFNPRYLKRDPTQAQWLFGIAKEAGCKLALSSDSHHPRDVGCRGEKYASEKEIRATGIEEGDVWRIEDRARARG